MGSVAYKLRPYLTPDKIDKRYRACKDAHSARYWLVIRLASLEPQRNRSTIVGRRLSTVEIGHIVGFSRQWVVEIIRRYNENGPKNFIPSPRHVEPNKKEPRLIRHLEGFNHGNYEENRRELLKDVQEGSTWTARRFQNYLDQRWELKVSTTTAWRYLKSLFSEIDASSGEKVAYRGQKTGEAFVEEYMPLFSIRGRAGVSSKGPHSRRHS